LFVKATEVKYLKRNHRQNGLTIINPIHAAPKHGGILAKPPASTIVVAGGKHVGKYVWVR
jgi:hypothetical protein